MAKRSYRQNCALALAADLVGERWTLLIIRDLLVGPKRYSELSQSLKGMGSNLLAARLRELQAAGIVDRQRSANGAHRYRLTDAGRALEPAVLALVRWGLRHVPAHDENYYHQDDWDLVALKAAFDPQRATGDRLVTQFATAGLTAWVEIGNGGMRYALGEAQDPDLTVEGTVEDLFVTAKRPEALLSSGSKRNLRRFMDAFAL
ncbi:MAG: helix-turn-helix domain-containing protein [Woeseiaceae bacterium]|nr:helix-turn-helix domain-containing protein [Woeseiaceae bacterium]